jgi:HTH-type transcriptional regulator/antitoxin HigA
MKELKYKIIKDKTQYNNYCSALERLLIADSKEFQDEIELLTLLIEKWDDEAEILSLLIDNFENEFYPIEEPNL